MTILLIALGAALGAPVRYLVDRLIQSRHDAVFPWGTLTVNVVGSFILGIVIAQAAGDTMDDWTVAFVGTGFCGALTTYSTFGYETMRLVETRARLYAAANIVVNVSLGLAAAAAGWTIGSG